MCLVLAALEPFALALKLLAADVALVVFNGYQPPNRHHLAGVGDAAKLIKLLHKFGKNYQWILLQLLDFAFFFSSIIVRTMRPWSNVLITLIR